MPAPVDLWNARFPDMFKLGPDLGYYHGSDQTPPPPAVPDQAQYYLDGVPPAQMPGIQQRNYGHDFRYGEPPQMTRRPEQLAPHVTEQPVTKLKTKDDYDKLPAGSLYEDTDGEIYEKAGSVKI